LSMLSRIRRNRAIAEAMSHFGHRGRVYLIAGWVPKDRVQELRTAVEQVAGGRVTFEENSPYVPGGRLHKVPTLLRNAGIFRPFESLVRTYGTPGYREIDPTPLVAITFVMMFGFMFGDLGHGLILFLVGLLMASRVIPKLAGLASLGWILVACGLSSSVFGILYGSIFGMEDMIPSLWLKPMKDIWTLLGASVVFGVLVLNIGFVCRVITAVREGRFVDAIFDKNGIAGMGLYWSLGAMVLFVALGRPLPFWLEGIVVILVFALFMAEPLGNLLKGVRPLVHGSVGELAVQAFFEVFEALISYVSNTLSYVRLGAFAVAHVGLTMVVSLLAGMLSSGPEGGILRTLVILMGNLFVIGFEGLIVSIQTLRLEYYELFGKFFQGEGLPFKPLTLPVVECPPGQMAGERSKS
jgi:V/A-type H+-transporting ATPase subunit I